jgi:hypothetical protein
LEHEIVRNRSGVAFYSVVKLLGFDAVRDGPEQSEREQLSGSADLLIGSFRREETPAFMLSLLKVTLP